MFIGLASVPYGWLNDALRFLTESCKSENQARTISTPHRRHSLRRATQTNNWTGLVISNNSFSISDLDFGEFRRQLSYKTPLYGARLSSHTSGTPRRGLLGLPLPKCPNCPVEHDRDQNATRNLYYLAASSAVTACGAEGAGSVDWPDETGRCEAGRFA